jgi:hypothetical protein
MRQGGPTGGSAERRTAPRSVEPSRSVVWPGGDLNGVTCYGLAVMSGTDSSPGERIIGVGHARWERSAR